MVDVPRALGVVAPVRRVLHVESATRASRRSRSVPAGASRATSPFVPYGTQLLFKADPNARYPFGTGLTTGLSATQVANPDLKWETSNQINFGIDYGFSNDRFTGVIDVYQKKTKDLILEVAVPQPAVVPTRLENVGDLKNARRGILARRAASSRRTKAATERRASWRRSTATR